MDKVLKIPVVPLDAEAFKPYGQVLGHGDVAFADVEDGKVEVRVNTRRNHSKLVKYISFHSSYNQTYIPMRGAVAFIVSPRPSNEDADPTELTVDYDGIRAFVLKAGQALHINHGIGHANVPIGGDCLMATVTRRHGKEIDNTMAFTEGRSQELKNLPKIAYVNMQARDGVVLELAYDSVDLERVV